MNFSIINIVKCAYNDSGYYAFSKVSRNLGDFPRCPACGSPIGAKVWLPPFQVTLEGMQVGDISCGTGDEFLVTQRFKQAWERSGLRGMTIGNAPVQILPSEGLPEVPPEYFLASPAHTITRLDEAASGLEIRKLVGCDVCRGAQRVRIRQLRIDETSWTGNDIFYPSGLYGQLVVTERFRLWVETHGFTNFEFVHQDAFHEERRET